VGRRVSPGHARLHWLHRSDRQASSPAGSRRSDRLKENPARCLLEDAERAVEASRQARERGDADAEASSARSAVFLYYAALEGFIKRLAENDPIIALAKLRIEYETRLRRISGRVGVEDLNG
jgi:hypothetical protein